MTIFNYHARSKIFLQRLQKMRDHIRRAVALFVYDRKRQPVLSQLASRQPNFLEPKQIVFVRWDAKLGDTIVTSWLFRELRKYDPSFQLVVIAPESFKSMFLNDMGADRVVIASKRPTFADIKRIAKEVGSAQYVMHMGEHLKPKDVYLLSKLDSNYVIGLDDEVKSINLKVGASTKGLHFADKVSVLMKHLGVHQFDQSYIVPFDAQAEARTDAWWPKKPVIIFNPIGRGHARQLSLAKSVSIVEYILKTTLADVLILIDPAKRNFAQAIKFQTTQTSRVCLSPDYPSSQGLGDLFASIRRCQAMVSVDTATVHIATGLKKPLFSFYNPQQNSQDFNFENWSPRSDYSISQLAKRVDPQVIDAINLNDFESLFSQFIHDFTPTLVSHLSLSPSNPAS